MEDPDIEIKLILDNRGTCCYSINIMDCRIRVIKELSQLQIVEGDMGSLVSIFISNGFDFDIEGESFVFQCWTFIL